MSDKILITRATAVGCIEWTGVPLAALLQRCGVKAGAVYTGPNWASLAPDREMAFGVPIERHPVSQEVADPRRLLGVEEVQHPT